MTLFLIWLLRVGILALFLFSKHHSESDDFSVGFGIGEYAEVEGEELDFSEQDALAQEMFESLGGRVVEDYTAFSQGLSDGYTSAYERDHRG